MHMNMNLQLTVFFTEEQAAEFLRHIEGEGGGQQFVRRCQELLRIELARSGIRRLVLTGQDPERWFRYRDNYGSGGFQSRLGREPVSRGSMF
jgi:hypothetical protein